MKKAAFIGLGILVGFATYSHAWLEEDTRSVSVDYIYDDDLGDDDGDGVEIGFGAALYELDDVSLKFAHIESSEVERQFMGLSFEENWPIPRLPQFAPFGAFAIGYGWTDVSSRSDGVDYDKSGMVLRPELGLKWVFCDWFAASTSFRYNFSNKKIYPDGKNFDFEDTNWEWAIGLRFYY